MTTNNNRKQESNNKVNKGTSDLSKAASIMRSNESSTKEKSKAASIMGHQGGKHSHDNSTTREPSRK